MINEFSLSYFLLFTFANTMNYTEILLNKNTSNEERILVANEIINTYNLDLNVEQILLAHANICEYVVMSYFKNNRCFLLNKLLNINTNLYVAIIIALCSGFNPSDLSFLMEIEQGKCINLGYCHYSSNSYNYYCKLQDYYYFDISDISNIPDIDKHKIEEYRQKIHSGKLTKKAIKND